MGAINKRVPSDSDPDRLLRMIGRFNQLCSAAEDLGAQDQSRQEPAALAELRERLQPAAQRLLIPERFAELPDDDALIVGQLLPAYERGRKSGRIDMDEVVKHIEAAGVLAFVGHSGGGCATIYAGRLPDLPDAHGDRRYPVMVGPGAFTAPDWQRPYSDPGDFCFGPDDDGDTMPVQIPDGTPPEKVAELVVAKVRQIEGQRKRLAEAVEAAGEAFWAEIAKHFPEVTSGDFGPDETITFERAQHAAVSLWLYYNAPEGGIAETAPPARPAVPQERYGHVDFDDLNHLNEPVYKRWTFRLADSVTDFAEAWEAALVAFSIDRQAYTKAVRNDHILYVDALVDQYPHILAAHGLTLVTELDGPTLSAQLDILVACDDDRCDFEDGDGLLCGQLLENGEVRDRKCGKHRTGAVPQSGD
ncbi:hypothetical protein [Micromonospora arborensis]|uniref:hypothetical protein n=1 Tax=Micromonospora arborensis TaxID=2116518 RepID=UPI0037136BA0